MLLAFHDAYEWYLEHKTPFELTTDLRSIFDRLTTKQIGAFPVYMEEVERLISEVREPVFVAAEFPGHGVWADRGRYGAYVKALHDRFPESRWKEYVKYLWIIDSEKAVFAIPSFGGEPTEYGFYTEEAGLLAALLSVWARYLENAEKLSAQPVLVKSG